jgi:hypothetical protein
LEARFQDRQARNQRQDGNKHSRGNGVTFDHQHGIAAVRQGNNQYWYYSGDDNGESDASP